jgi:hypothetical protein
VAVQVSGGGSGADASHVGVAQLRRRARRHDASTHGSAGVVDERRAVVGAGRDEQ